MNTEIYVGTKVMPELFVKKIIEDKRGLSYELVTEQGYIEGFSLNTICVPESAIKEVVDG